MLGNLECNNVHIVYSLRCAGCQDDPACIQAVIQVRMIAADIQRSADCAGNEIKHHGKTCARLGRKLLQHIQKPLRTSGVDDPCASHSCAITDSRRTMFAVSSDKLNVMLPPRLHLIEILGNLSRRGDREIAHHVVVDLCGCCSRHFIAGFKACDLLGRHSVR
ncbi:hypothetical protein D3C75_812440 [compost metagenome]